MLQTAFLTVAGYSLQAAIVILVVVLMRFLLRKMGAPTVVSYTLWAVVLFRLLFPFSIESSIGVIPEEIADVPQEHAVVDYEYVPVDTAILAPSLSLGGVMGGSIDGADFTYESETVGPNQDGSGRIFPVGALLLTLGVLWPVGMVALVIYSVITYFRLRRKLVGAVPLEGNIRLADHITSPFVMGLFRPKIYLPSNLSELEREYIILHERHHIRRLDHIIKVLAFAALCIHWFNPLVWLAFYLSGKDMEMSCDEAVIKKLGEGIRADYSASLLSLSTGRTVIAATPLAFGEGDTGSRIKNLAKWKKPAVWITVVAVILCAAVIVLCATNSSRESSLKVQFGSGGVEIDCRFDDETQAWAIYEDIYLEGTRISSVARISDTFVENGGVSEREMTMKMKALTTIAEDSGFAGILQCSYEGAGLMQWELKLPRQHYMASGTTLGDGSKNANGIRRDLQDDGEAILFSVMFSTKAGITPVHKEKGIIGANDTVVQYRLVTADYVRDWPEEGTERLSQQYTSSEIYVSERCLYLTPYSSYAALGGDSGYRYLMNESGFYKSNRSNTTVANLAAGEEWENWQDFPWSDQEWKALFCMDLWNVDVDGYDKREYCALSQNACLLRMDGALWLVEFSHNEQMGTHIYSIYQLVPERAKGSAQWNMGQTIETSAFPFVFDMEYDEISAVCTERPLVDFDGFEPPSEIGIYSPTADHALVFPEGHAVYWYPLNVNREYAANGTIHFTVHREEQMVCAGTIYIHSWVDAETGNRTYSATLVGTGLVMEQNPDGGAIIRTAGRKGNINSQQGLMLYEMQTEPVSGEDDPGLSFEELAVGAEVHYPSPIVFAEDEGWLEYSLGYDSPGVVVEFGLRAANGTEISQTVKGGHANGTLEHIPAGSYVLFVRNSSEPEVHAPMYTLELGVMNFRCSGVTEKNICRSRNALDRAVTQAVHTRFMDGDPTGLLNATNHVLLDSIWEENTVTAYVLAMHKTYRNEELKLEPQPVDSKFVAVKLTFVVEDGKYTLTDYWEPRRLFYESDIRTQFTPFAAQEVLDPDVYEVNLDHQCDNAVRQLK